MLLLRGATECYSNRKRLPPVSIHAPLARSNFGIEGLFEHEVVSIHAPLARSNGRATLRQKKLFVSIHAPLARSNIVVRYFSIFGRFQYMLLLRGATVFQKSESNQLLFQYMLLLRGATEILVNSHVRAFVSIHAPLARSNMLARTYGDKFDVSIHAPLARSNAAA